MCAERLPYVVRTLYKFYIGVSESGESGDLYHDLRKAHLFVCKIEGNKCFGCRLSARFVTFFFVGKLDANLSYVREFEHIYGCLEYTYVFNLRLMKTTKCYRECSPFMLLSVGFKDLKYIYSKKRRYRCHMGDRMLVTAGRMLGQPSQAFAFRRGYKT